MILSHRARSIRQKLLRIQALLCCHIYAVHNVVPAPLFFTFMLELLPIDAPNYLTFSVALEVDRDAKQILTPGKSGVRSPNEVLL